MLVRQFGKAVSWWFDFDQHYERGRRWGEKLDGFLHRASGGEQRDAATQQRMRQQVIHDVAARAVEWNWDKPDKIYDFIRAEEPPGGGYMKGVTAAEIFQYSQQNFTELLPKRGDPASQSRLDALRKNGQPQAPSLDLV